MLPAPWAADRSSSSPTPACSVAPSASCSTAPRRLGRPRAGRLPGGPARRRGPRRRPPGGDDPQPHAAAARRTTARAPARARRAVLRRRRAGPPRAARAVLVAWGARAVLACAAVPRARCWPSTTTCRPGRRWPPRCAPRPGAPTAWSRPRTPSRAGWAGGATILHPGVDLAAWPVAAAGRRPAARARARRARAVEAGRPGARDRRSDPRAAAHDRGRADAGRRPGVRGRAEPPRGGARPRRPRHLPRRRRRPAPRARRARTCCCTAPTPSRSGWRSLEALASGPAGRRARRRRAAGDRRRTAPARCTRRATPRRPPTPCGRCSPTRGAPPRSAAEAFPVEASAARFAAAVEAVA